MAKTKDEEGLGSTEFLDSVAGGGFEEMGTSALGIPYLYLVQESSPKEVKSMAPPKHFINTVTREDYGESVRVVVCGFKVCWTEVEPDSGRKVGRYEPGSIEVIGDPFKGMTSVATKNKIVETWLYQLVLPEHPETGFMIYASTPGNMRNLKNWNTQMRFLRLPSGKPAPGPFVAIWEITAGDDVSRAGKEYYSFRGGIKQVGWINDTLYNDAVLPAQAQNRALIAAPVEHDVADATETEY